jgi:positive regulator of sigma E activity
MNTWQPNCQEEATCAACDFRYFCPSEMARRTDRANADNDDDGI